MTKLRLAVLTGISLLCVCWLGFQSSNFHYSWLPARGYVASSNARLQPSKSIDTIHARKSLRPTAMPVGLDSWAVVDAFPESNHLGGAMQLCSHPTEKDRWFVLSFTGQVFDIRRTEDGLSIRKIVDIASAEVGWVYSMALHPNFHQGHPTLFLFYRSGDSAVDKYLRVSEFPIHTTAVSGPTGENILIEQQVEHYEHLGGGLDFDGSGCLLIAVGDNGLYNDVSEHSQKLTGGLFSGILRIDVDRRGGQFSFISHKTAHAAKTGGYFIPRNNPFVNVDFANPEFWSLGFRNPFRINFDKVSETAWVGEVGQNRIEQLEAARSGTNHLWSFKEGSERFPLSYLDGEPPRNMVGQPTFPFYEYPHEDQDYCIVAGPVYRSDRYPQLTGSILFGDNQSGRIWALNVNSANQNDRKLLLRLPSGKRNASLTSIAVDISGRIFLTSFAAGAEGVSVHELVPDVPEEMPDRLSATGYFSSLKPLTPNPSFVPYSMNAPLWSDGMKKLRWFALPSGEKVSNAGDEFTHWKFPAGTVFVKHFQNPAVDDRPLETRILIAGENNQIYGATYEWYADASDAELVLNRSTIDISNIPTAAKVNSHRFEYRLPGPDDCLVCHNPDNRSLGLTAAQLNLEDSDSINQLLELSEKGLLEHPYPIETVQRMQRLVGIESQDHSMEMRARSYLHSNCSFCHHQNGTQRTEFLATLQTPLASAHIVGEKAKTFYMSIDGRETHLLISPGRPDDSLLYRRFTTLDLEYAMPHLGRSTIDVEAASVLSTWIEELGRKSE